MPDQEATPEADRLFKIAQQLFQRGSYQQAERAFAKTQGLYKKSASVAKIGEATRMLGEVCRRTGRLDEGEKHYEDAIRLFRSEQDAHLASALAHMGDLALQRGQLAKARQNYEEAIDWERLQGTELALANAVRRLAMLEYDHGRVIAATTHWTEALSLYETANIVAGVAESLTYLADLANRRKDHGKSRDLAQRARAAAAASGDSEMADFVQETVGHLLPKKS